MEFNMTNLGRKVQQIMLALLLLALPAGAQTVRSMVDAVSDSALFSTIAGLQGFGTRWCLSGNSLQVSKWVRGQFVAAGVTDVALDSFVYGTQPQANVVATLPGIRYPEREIIVGAHIDSKSSSPDFAPGADDDASGTAAVLEMARVMVTSGYRNSSTIRFIGFAAEEAGLVGSDHYASAAKAAGRNIILMLNLDMIGYTSSANPERRFNIQGYAPDTETATLVADAAKQYTSLTPVVSIGSASNVDSYSFAVEGYTAVTCIEYQPDRNPHYHKPTDLIGTLDTSYITDITRTSLAAILLYDGVVESSVTPLALAPSAARLEQNYPNPFNPTTEIRSQMSEVRHVKLAVYDLLGREVAVLVDERRPAGSYQDSFDASGLANGVYIYRLTAGPYVASKKMVLLR